MGRSSTSADTDAGSVGRGKARVESEAFRAWREAHQAALEAERSLAEAIGAFAEGAGPVPSEQLAVEARLLRAAATALFEKVQSELASLQRV